MERKIDEIADILLPDPDKYMKIDWLIGLLECYDTPNSIVKEVIYNMGYVDIRQLQDSIISVLTRLLAIYTRVKINLNIVKTIAKELFDLTNKQIEKIVKVVNKEFDDKDYSFIEYLSMPSSEFTVEYMLANALYTYYNDKFNKKKKNE